MLDVLTCEHYESHMTVATLNAIDLFCGCGGMSAGANAAGFKIVAGVDIEEKFIATFRSNFPNSAALRSDISGVPPEQFADQVGIKAGEVDLLMGGPPCQGFSKNVPARYRYLDDPKNLLVKSFLDYAEELRPRIILMENVAEMKNGFGGSYTEEIVERLGLAGYNVTYAILNAADYGVPQRRRRAFFMANRHGLQFVVPSASHAAQPRNSLFDAQQPHVSVWEAIGDLPSIDHGEGQRFTPYAKDPFSPYQNQVRSTSGLVSNHVARKLQPVQFERLHALKPGQGHKDLPTHLQVKSGYSGAYGRLTMDMVAPTITRWVFHPGSGRWGHPVDTRVLSIREAARIQGFYDDFEFFGSYLQQAGQLGNAVPPLLAEAILRDLLAQIESYSASRNSTSRSSGTLSPSDGSEKRVA